MIVLYMLIVIIGLLAVGTAFNMIGELVTKK